MCYDNYQNVRILLKKCIFHKLEWGFNVAAFEWYLLHFGANSHLVSDSVYQLTLMAVKLFKSYLYSCHAWFAANRRHSPLVKPLEKELEDGERAI